MLVNTREGQHFLTLNGIQTMSAQTESLLAQMPELLAQDIDAVRISPQPAHTFDILEAFDRARRGEAVTDKEEWAPAGLVNGFWFGRAGTAHQVA
jgi:collagenase-like PrtC family protease